MYLRLYFLLPDDKHSRRVADTLRDAGIDGKYIRAHRRNTRGLPQEGATDSPWERVDSAEKVEKWAWNTDLVIFTLALLGLVIALWQGSTLFTLVSLIVMAATFLAGNFFAEYIPRVHLREFEHALSHGEVLLMVDVPHKRVAEIEDMVHHQHPAAIAGGSSWTIQSLGI